MEDKINYIIQVLEIMLSKAKAIGALNDYELGTEDESAYLPVYLGNQSLTDKVSITDLIAHLAQEALSAHTHEIGDITDLAEALASPNFFTDVDGNKWGVIRRSNDYDYTSLQAYDKIEGWEDETTKSTWLEGVVLNAGLSVPSELRDKSKFLITNEKWK